MSLSSYLWNPKRRFQSSEQRLPAERFETLDRLRSISQSYGKVIEHCQQRGDHLCLDATQSIEEIHENLYRSRIAMELHGTTKHGRQVAGAQSNYRAVYDQMKELLVQRSTTISGYASTG